MSENIISVGWSVGAKNHSQGTVVVVRVVVRVVVTLGLP